MPRRKISLRNKNILVTGGTGSFGHQVVSDLINKKPRQVIIFSRDEDKQDKMRYEFSHLNNLRFLIGDVRDKESLKRAMRGADIVFHAAALKYVPSSEYNAMEAVRTNILGAQNVFEIALEENVMKVVAISTDKAVEPVNVMGMSKAIQERLATLANLHRGNKKTVFVCVRYGNVVGSRGSVVPLFKKQIDENKDITLTHREMTRFILTLPDSVRLIFKAAEEGMGGEVFVLEIPSHTVLDLAEVMVENSGKKLKIKETGIRPGEKVHETLISPIESLRTVRWGDFFVILPQIEISETNKFYQRFKKAPRLWRFSSDIATKLDKKQIFKILKRTGWIQ